MGNNFLKELLKKSGLKSLFDRIYKREKLTFKYAYGFFLLFVLIIIGTLLMPGDITFQYADYKQGTIAKERIIAPDTFPIIKTEEEIAEERRRARDEINAQFYRDSVTEQTAVENLSIFFNYLSDYSQLTDRKNALLRQNPARDSSADSLRLKQIDDLDVQIDAITTRFRQQDNIDVEKPYWDFIYSMDRQNFIEFRDNCRSVLSDILAVGMVNVAVSGSEYEGTRLTLTENGGESERSINEFVDNESVPDEVSGRMQFYYSFPSDTLNAGFQIVKSFLIPNIRIDFDVTEQLRREAVQLVPLTRGYVFANERIIDRHERITPDVALKIESLRVFLTEQGMLKNKFSQFLIYFGQAGFLSIVLFFFVIYVYQFRPNLLKSSRRLTMIFLIFLLLFLFIYFITQQLGLSEYIVPTTICTMLLAILFDGGIGLYGSIVIAFVTGAFLGHDFTVSIYALAGGVAAALSVRRIRTRGQFYKSTMLIFTTYAIVLYTSGIMQLTPLSEVTMIVLKQSLPNAIFAPLITLGFLALFESVFNVATDMTLLELSDLNRPLLRELALHAPGTYHHSIVLGNLSERAAEAINANSLLARVGCYYHDIGKMVKPEYFIENQPDARERHEALAPSMSSIIISSHVRDGLEMAKKYKLPQNIQDFIMQHHGTSRISFFYEKAIAKAGEKYVNESDFQYPGPKPQTKETGIVMLADGVEAATRALQDPSPSRIIERVRSIVEKRFLEGQLDECPLTLRDLHAITESFIQILNGIFHVRLEYPQAEQGEFAQTEDSERKTAKAESSKKRDISEPSDKDNGDTGR